MRYIILFKGIRVLMKVDKLCKSCSLAVSVIPIPHKYTTECGMSLLIDGDDVSKFEKIASENNIEFRIEKYE